MSIKHFFALTLLLLFITFNGKSQSVSVAVMNVQVKDMVYDSVLSSILISIPSTDPLNGNSIGFVNPALASFTTVVPVGDEPNPLALTDNGQFLYFGSDSTGTIRKMDLFNQSIIQTIQMHIYGNSGQAIAKKIACQPGNDSVIAVTGRYLLTTGVPAARIYSNGVKLPDTVNSIYITLDVIQFKTPSILFGYNNHTTSSEFTTNDVTPTGISVANYITTAFLNDFGIEFTINGNLALADNGRTVHLSQSPPVPGGWCNLLPNMGYGTKKACFDPYLDLLCIARRVNLPGSDSIYIERFRRTNYLPYDVIRVSTSNSEVRKIINWGGAGKYAISTNDGKLIIVDATPTGLNEINEAEISISPNPGNGIYSIRFPEYNKHKNVRLEVYDSNGKRIIDTDLKEEMVSLDLSGYSIGTYLIKINTDTNSFNSKIIKF